MMKNKLIIILIIKCFVFNISLYACECDNYELRHSDIYSNDNIEIGYIKKINIIDDYSYCVDLDVENVIKGKSVDKITVLGRNSSCDYNMEVGQRWLLLSNLDTVFTCSKSSNSEGLYFNENLDFLLNYTKIIDNHYYSVEDLDSLIDFPFFKQKIDTLFYDKDCTIKKMYMRIRISSTGSIIDIQEINKDVRINQYFINKLNSNLEKITNTIANNRVNYEFFIPVNICNHALTVLYTEP